MTLQELADYHEKQAIYFEPFGATNALTVFHREAADCALAFKRDEVRQKTSGR